MITPITLIQALESAKLAASAGIDVANILNTHENMIDKNSKLEIQCNRAFTGYSSVSADELTEDQKGLLNYQYDYVMPGANNSFRKTVGSAIEYYLEKPYNNKVKKDLENLCSDRSDTIHQLNIKITELEAKLAEQNAAMLKIVQDVQI